MEFIDIGSSDAMRAEAARMLYEVFSDINGDSWPTIESAENEVTECTAEDAVCIGMINAGELIGWAGIRKMYERTWELHPLVVGLKHQNRGFGTLLLQEIEKRAMEMQLDGIVLGTDDETFRTSLSRSELHGGNILKEIAEIRNIGRHPFEFYEKCGYRIVGVIPDANGKNKPDIWMWKSLRRS